MRTWPYPNEMENREDLECDVLVLGAGVSGCFAAIAAAQHGQNVILVEKGSVHKTGLVSAKSHIKYNATLHLDYNEDGTPILRPTFD